jgi:hypothetical protein
MDSATQTDADTQAVEETQPAAQEVGELSADDKLLAALEKSFDDEPEETLPAKENAKAEGDDEESDKPEDAEIEEAELDELTIDQLAEALELDPSDLMGKLQLSAKVNGTEQQVNLAKAIEHYQKAESYEQNAQQLANDRKAFENEALQSKEAVSQQIQQAQAMVEMMEQSILSKYNNVDWQTLKMTDPEQHNELVYQLQQDQRQIEGYKDHVSGAVQAQQAEQEQQRSQHMAQYMEIERKALLTALPEWQDQAIAIKEKGEVRDFLKNQYGFSDEMLGNVYDHRLILMAKDAIKGRNLGKKVDVGAKKVTAAPKLLKSGATKSKAQLKQANMKALKAKLIKGGGNVDDVAALLTERM